MWGWLAVDKVESKWLVPTWQKATSFSLHLKLSSKTLLLQVDSFSPYTLGHSVLVDLHYNITSVIWEYFSYVLCTFVKQNTCLIADGIPVAGICAWYSDWDHTTFNVLKLWFCYTLSAGRNQELCQHLCYYRGGQWILHAHCMNCLATVLCLQFFHIFMLTFYHLHRCYFIRGRQSCTGASSQCQAWRKLCDG